MHRRYACPDTARPSLNEKFAVRVTRRLLDALVFSTPVGTR